MNVKARKFGSNMFLYVGSIRPEKNEDGKVKEYTHILPPGIRGNLHAAGPYCRFKLSHAPDDAGVYAITEDGEVKYVGECESLLDRFGPGGYGRIAARNCHHDGQSTNCKVNSLILKSTKEGKRVDLWFYKCPRRKNIEARLLGRLRPSWNGKRRAGKSEHLVQRPREDCPPPSADDFRRALKKEFRMSGKSGMNSLMVRSGNLHGKVGGYPGQYHRMPTCCQVMMSEMQSGDKVVDGPLSGAGANLVIEYKLPRLQTEDRS